MQIDDSKENARAVIVTGTNKVRKEFDELYLQAKKKNVLFLSRQAFLLELLELWKNSRIPYKSPPAP